MLELIIFYVVVVVLFFCASKLVNYCYYSEDFYFYELRSYVIFCQIVTVSPIHSHTFA